MKNLGTFKAATTLLALAVTAAGCAMQAGTPSVGPSSSVVRAAPAPLAVPDSNKKLAGTYNGDVQWSIGTETSSGTLETILRFRHKNIQGPFRITEHGQTYNFRIYGRIMTKTSAAAATINFLVYNKAGTYVVGSGSIANGVFAGTAKSPAGRDPAVLMLFSVTKDPKG